MRAFFLADEPVRELLGASRFYPNHKTPANADTPYATYRKTSDTKYTHLRGSNLRRARVEIHCHGENFAAARELANAIHDAIGEDGLGNVDWDGWGVQYAGWDDEGEDFDSPIFGDDTGFHRVNLDLIVVYEP